MRFTFKKEEKLSSNIAIKALHREGKTLKQYPFLIFWKYVELESDFPAKIAFSVAKKRFKLAVDRNLMKRRLREGYRLNKHELYQVLNSQNKKIEILLVYISTDFIETKVLESKMKVLLQKLINEISD